MADHADYCLPRTVDSIEEGREAAATETPRTARLLETNRKARLSFGHDCLSPAQDGSEATYLPWVVASRHATSPLCGLCVVAAHRYGARLANPSQPHFVMLPAQSWA